MPGASTKPLPTSNVLALAVAVVVGYFLGLLEALDRLPYRDTLRLAAVGLAITLVIALAGSAHERGAVRHAGSVRERGSAGRTRGSLLERIFVLQLRVGLSGGVFVFVFEGMRLLLKIGLVGGAVASWAAAGILGLLLARLAPAGGWRPASAGRHQ